MERLPSFIPSPTPIDSSCFFFYYRSLSDEKQRKCTISTKKHPMKRLFR